MEFDDLPAKAQRIVTVQRARIEHLEDPETVVELQRDLIVSLITDLMGTGVSAPDIADLIVTMFDVQDLELVRALEATRGVRP